MKIELSTIGQRMGERVHLDRPGVLEYGYWAFLLIAVGRVNQLIPVLGLLPLAKITMAFAVIAAWANRKRLLPLTPEGRALAKTGTYLVIVALALTPVSFWRGASLVFATTRLPVLVVAAWVAATMRTSWRSLRGTFLVLVFCGLILAGAAVSGYSGGRAADEGTMYDPNDLAYLLVTLVPLTIAFLIDSRSTVHKVLYGIAAATVTIALLLTQSRGGLLGFLTVVALMTVVPLKGVAAGSGKAANKGFAVKVATVLVVSLLGMAVWSHLPESAQARFSTLLHLSSDYNLDPNDTSGRGDIWLRGIKAAQERPWGYGPESFFMVDLTFGGKFNAPHNSYLQSLVELGIAGLLLFLRVYYLAFRGLQRARSRLVSRTSLSGEQSQQALFARAIQISLAGNMVSGFFLSEAYAEILWVTVGLCMALFNLMSQESAVSGETLPRQLPQAEPKALYGERRYTRPVGRRPKGKLLSAPRKAKPRGPGHGPS